MLQNNNETITECLMKSNYDMKKLVNLDLTACNRYPYHIEYDKGKMGRDKAQMRLLDLAKLECPNFKNREIMDISSAGWWKFYTQASRAVPL